MTEGTQRRPVLRQRTVEAGGNQRADVRAALGDSADEAACTAHRGSGAVGADHQAGAQGHGRRPLTRTVQRHRPVRIGPDNPAPEARFHPIRTHRRLEQQAMQHRARDSEGMIESSAEIRHRRREKQPAGDSADVHAVDPGTLRGNPAKQTQPVQNRHAVGLQGQRGTDLRRSLRPLHQRHMSADPAQQDRDGQPADPRPHDDNAIHVSQHPSAILPVGEEVNRSGLCAAYAFDLLVGNARLGGWISALSAHLVGNDRPAPSGCGTRSPQPGV